MALEDRIRLPALNLIHRRPRLLKLLTGFVEARYRLITVYAPGGYGKSILLADFAQTTDLPVCWCSLEPVDRDPTSFLLLLAYSITDRFHEIEPESLMRLIQQGDTQLSIYRIADLLARVGPHLIIIDDYHKAVSAGMNLALNKLLEALPSTSTMLVAARGDMNLETGQIIDLLISQRATGLSEEELRFTSEELQRVMRKRFGRQIDLVTAEEIGRATDGNIAQILLSGHLMHVDGLVHRLRQRLGDDRRVIYSYLAEEVLDKQPPELQEFMLHTSVLSNMTPDLCNELLGITDARTHLEQLVRKDLFITQVGVGLKYHDLFTEFLRAKLAETPALYRRISIKAGDLLAGQAHFEEAIVLYLSVQAWDAAVALLESKGRFFYDTGRALTLHTWLSQIPEPELARRPRLLLLQGQILYNDLGKSEQAMALFRQAEDRFREQNNPISAAEAQVWQSVSLRVMGRAQESLALVIRGLTQLEALQADKRVMAWAIRHRGIVYAIVGSLGESLADLRRALELFEQLDDTYYLGLCHQDIGILLERSGNVSAAIRHFNMAVQIWESLGNANDLARTLNSLGVSLHTIARYDEALKRLNESLDIATQIGATTQVAFAHASTGDVHLVRQEYKQAIEAFHKSTDFAQAASMHSLEIYNTVKLGECFYQQHNLDQALSLAVSARQSASENGLGFEMGLACALMAKIYVYRARKTSFALFAEALTSFGESNVLEQARVRLWWGYSLLLDLRARAAFDQLQQAISLALGMDELRLGLGPTIADTRQLLLHFFHRGDTPADIRGSIRLLLEQEQHWRKRQAQIEVVRPGLQVFAFGPPSLIVAGKYKHFLSMRGNIHKMPEFLLYLILAGQGEGCRWSELSLALWPDIESNRASNNFHQLLRRLRDSILGSPGYITIRNDLYQINSDYLEWCDALAFETLFERAATAGSDEALALRLELIALYQGEFLGGFELEEWGHMYRTKFETRFLQTVKLTSEQLLADGSPQEALTIINKGLTQDYFQEDLHRYAGQAYAQLGLYNDLAAYYVHLCDTFEQELGAQPTPETQRLYAQLMDKKPT